MLSACKTLVDSCRGWLTAAFEGTRKAIEDVIVSMIPQAVSLVTGFLTSILIARGLGPKGMGNYALILSVSGMAAALSDLGIGQTAIRFASQAVEKNDSGMHLAILRWAFRVRVLLVSIISLAVFIAAPLVVGKLWHDPTLVPLVRLSLLTSIFAAIAAIPTIYFQSLKRFKMNAAVTVGQTLVSFFGIAGLALLNQWSLQWVITVTVVAAGLAAITFIILVPKASFLASGEFQSGRSIDAFRPPKQNTQTSTSLDATGMNEFAFFMVLSSLLVIVIMRTDVWLMGFYLDKAQIGLYNVASRFTLPLVVVLGALNTALWPRASALTSFEKALGMLKKTFKLSLLVAVAGMAYSILVPLVTPVVFGEVYRSGVTLGQVLCLRYCIAILTSPIGVIGYSLGLVRAYTLINILQLVTVVAINVLLLQKMGAMAAALSVIGNEVVGFCLLGIIIFRRLKVLRGEYGI